MSVVDGAGRGDGDGGFRSGDLGVFVSGSGLSISFTKSSNLSTFEDTCIIFQSAVVSFAVMEIPRLLRRRVNCVADISGLELNDVHFERFVIPDF